MNLLLPVAAALSLWLASASDAIAGKAELDALISQPARPTMEQVLTAAGPEGIHQSPYADINIRAYDSKYSRQMRDWDLLPKAIAFMEKAFPGAVWAPLGRDAVIFGDALDAFYISLGQHGRVSRINASGASFEGYEGEELEAARVKLLESAGLDLKHVLESRPFVGIDCTKFASMSQSASLLRAAYRAYAKQGGNPEDLVAHLNFFALNSGISKKATGAEAIEAYFMEAPSPLKDQELSRILHLETGSWHHSAEWHDTFEKLMVQPNGKFEGAPGPNPRTDEERKAILAYQLELFQKVSRPEFLAAVRESARSLGYEFPVTNADTHAVIGQLAAERTQRLRHQVENYGKDRENRLERGIEWFREIEKPRPPVADHVPDNVFDDLESYNIRRSRTNREKLNDFLQNERKIRERLANALPQEMAAFTESEALVFAIKESTRLQKYFLDSDYSLLIDGLLSSAPLDDYALKELAALYEREPPFRARADKREDLCAQLKKILEDRAVGCAKVFD